MKVFTILTIIQAYAVLSRAGVVEKRGVYRGVGTLLHASGHGTAAGEITQAIPIPYSSSQPAHNHHYQVVEDVTPHYHRPSADVGSVTEAIATPFPDAHPSRDLHLNDASDLRPPVSVSYQQNYNNNNNNNNNIEAGYLNEQVSNEITDNSGNNDYHGNQGVIQQGSHISSVGPSPSGGGGYASGYQYRYLPLKTSDAEYEGIYVPSWLGGLNGHLIGHHGDSGYSDVTRGHTGYEPGTTGRSIAGDIVGLYVPSWLGGLHGRRDVDAYSRDVYSDHREEDNSEVEDSYSTGVTNTRARDSGYGAGTGFHGLPKLS